VLVVFTDLDGTLLDRETYAWDAARPAVQFLRDHEIPWIFVTSKTKAEAEYWRQVTGNEHPFVVEDGGAILAPTGYFADGIPGAVRRNGYETLVWGRPYADLIAGLDAASRMSGCRVRGFHQMTAAEIATACRLPLEQAILAKRRQYDEPFEIFGEGCCAALESAIAAQGFVSVRGGRFHHISAPHDKGCAVRVLSNLFRRSAGRVKTVGLGDGWNDLPLLLAVDVPVVMPSRDAVDIVRKITNAIVADQPGPKGWNEIVLDMARDRDETA